MQHRVVLSNGRVLLIEERVDERSSSLHFASEQEGFPGEADMYVCQFEPSGVLVMTNSGDAVEWLTQGLKKQQE